MTEESLPKRGLTLRKNTLSTNEGDLSRVSTIEHGDPLLECLFGRKTYSYRLELVDELPEMLYKEKNFNVRVKLVNIEKQRIMNSNIIRLCFSVCDTNGAWITENKDG